MNLSPFDAALRDQHWNRFPQRTYCIPTSEEFAINAATAIAICAYPQGKQLSGDGKAYRYQQALLAYIIRVSHWVSELSSLPEWVTKLRTDKMWDRLEAGHRNLMRSFVVRDLITAALIEKTQIEAANRSQIATFQINFSKDLRSSNIEIPIGETPNGRILVGKIPGRASASLRSAILRHRAALSEFEGPSPRVEGNDEDHFYRNVLSRHVKPALFTGHIQQIVWEAAMRYREEANTRRLPIDQILMRKGDWARDIRKKCLDNAGVAIEFAKQLGVPACSCKLIHLGEPSPAS